MINIKLIMQVYEYTAYTITILFSLIILWFAYRMYVAAMDHPGRR